MTIFAASPASYALPAVRRAACAALFALVVCLLTVTPARAVVTTVGGSSVGLQPRTGVLATQEPKAHQESVETFGNATGAVVLHGTLVYPIYWDPEGHSFHEEWLTKIDGFFRDMGGASGSLGTIFASIGQYRDRSNMPAQYRTVYMGSYHDTAKYPAAGCTDPNPAIGAITCLTDAQLREQLQSFVAGHGLPKGMSVVYYLLTPPGVTVCVDEEATVCSDYKVAKAEEEKRERKAASYANSFCSYHADINPDKAAAGDGNTILYAAIPWTAGSLGLFQVPAFTFPSLYAEAFDCQDGGWSPVNEKGENAEVLETSKEMTKAEEEAEAKATAEEKAALFKKHRLEFAHQQEPNQEGKGERGDYGAGLADLIINQIAEEQANIVTDPLLSSWKNEQGEEVTDECRNVFGNTVSAAEESGIQGTMEAEPETEAGTLSNEALGGGRYYINNSWSISGSHCSGGAAMVPRFTAPNPVNSGEIVGFDGMASSVGLDEGLGFGPSGPPTKTYATFSWNFGDGTPVVKGFAPGSPICEAPWLSPCAASVYHAYAYGGTYTVTLTVTDVAGNTSSTERVVTVVGPSAPAPAPGGGSPGGSPEGNRALPAPLAAAAIVSRSLKKALHNGLAVRYSVSEKVAGHFEVMLSAELARRLHIGGAPATGLPAGTPAQIVIARAVIVTTKGGRSTISIRLSKKTAKRLAHVRSASLMLRMIVRNASSTQPQTAVVLSKATLSH